MDEREYFIPLPNDACSACDMKKIAVASCALLCS